MSSYTFYVSPWRVVCYGDYVSSGEKFNLGDISKEIEKEKPHLKTLAGLVIDTRGGVVAVDFSFKRAIDLAGIVNMGSIDGKNSIESVALFLVERNYLVWNKNPQISKKEDLFIAYCEGHKGKDVPDFLMKRTGYLF